ncbi:FxSxx-COOH system tetratricopeptide repeat protein [Streptomyces sp. NPDC086080]|uniref:FxSxx-COOH system tetratricopeptide repeat protein n=1 Tax=Streptomyces sp. NPDC086080 TaxID=3365748 RepID=UPI0037CFD352
MNEEPGGQLPSWHDVRDALYLTAWRDEAAPYRHWTSPAARHSPTGNRSQSADSGTAAEQGKPEPDTAERPAPGTGAPPSPQKPDAPGDRPYGGDGPSAPVAGGGPAETPAERADRPAAVEQHGPSTAAAPSPASAPSSPAGVRLAGHLALARALRPLRLFIDVPDAWRLEEEATARRAAEDDLWLPVCRPRRVRRLRLHLLVDAGESMKLWKDTVQWLRRLTEHTGAFRTVTVSTVDVAVAGMRAGAGEVPVAGTGPDDVVLLVTDAVGQAWRGTSAALLLHALARRSPTAVLSLLPQELWELTLPSAVSVQVDTPVPAATNGRLALRAVGRPTAELGDRAVDRERERPPIPVPVLELTPQSLGQWARLVAGQGNSHRIAALLTGPQGDLGARSRPRTGLPDAPTGNPREMVHSFAGKASPIGLALALRLAAAPLNLPVMRSIQRSLPGAKDWNLAEVMLFGLIRPTGHGPASESMTRVSFDFLEGVREELLGLSTRAETVRVLRQVEELVGPHLAASVADGAAAVAWRSGAPDPPISDLTRPFVRPVHSALAAVSGPFLDRAGRLERLLDADRTAAVGVPTPVPTGKMTWSDVSDTVVPPSPASTSAATPLGPLSAGVPGGSVSTAQSVTPPRVHLGAKVPPRLWGNVPQRNRNFTGRDAILAGLRQRLADGTTAVLPEALHGMGGVGKSQIAIEYVYRSSRDYQLVWWIPSEQTNLIVQSLIELGEQMGLRAGADRGAVPTVLEALRIGEPYSNWLLVFDNAENPHEVRQFFPNDGPGRVMVTSRNSQWSNLASSLEVDVFARDESVALIRRRSPDIPDDAADRLADSLGDLPLAVEQAAVWLAETGMPVNQYLDLFETKYAELLRVDPPADYDLPVAAAWNVSLDRLREDHPAALHLLQVCAFFAPEPIDWDLFSAVRGVTAPDSLRATLADPIKLGRAVREIGRYALARIDHRKSTIQVHRLVQRVLVEQMNTQERAEMRHAAHEILANSDPRNPQRSAEWPRYSALLPHVKAARMVECEDPWVRELVLNEARFLESRSDYVMALEVAEEAAAIWRRLLGDEHEHVMAIDQVRAQALRWTNRYDEAFAVQSELVERCHRVLGERHLATQRAVSFMALLHRARGDFYRARALDKQAYDTLLREFGADDPGTLQSAHNYAVSLRLSAGLGDLKEAYEVDEDTYHRRVEVLGDDHLHTLLSLHCLYIDIQELGRYQDAVDGHEQLRDRALVMLGEEHSLTVWATRELSVARRKLGDHDGAFALSQQVIEIYRGKPMQELHGLAWASLNHATDLRHAGDVAAAVQLGRETMRLCTEAMGERHPHTYSTATNLAVSLRLLERTEEALELNQEAVKGLGQVLSPTHARTLLARTNLASDLVRLGQVERARDLGIETLDHSVHVRGEQHPDTLAVKLNLSYDMRGFDEAAAQELYDSALNTMREVLGPEHPATVDAAAGRRANCDIDMLSI